jgi:ribonuclease P protein component
VLPPENRLRRSADFRHALRGRRGVSRTVVVHAAAPAQAAGGVRVGFVVNRAVGTAVARNQVKRRLRHAVRDELSRLETVDPVDIVVRATPKAADATFDDLRSDLNSALGAVGRVSA